MFFTAAAQPPSLSHPPFCNDKKVDWKEGKTRCHFKRSNVQRKSLEKGDKLRDKTDAVSCGRGDGSLAADEEELGFPLPSDPFHLGFQVSPAESQRSLRGRGCQRVSDSKTSDRDKNAAEVWLQCHLGATAAHIHFKGRRQQEPSREVESLMMSSGVPPWTCENGQQGPSHCTVMV